MNITQEKINDLNAVVTVKITPDDYQEKVNKAIKDQAKKMKLPGFRPGMVPPAHVKKMYGKSILVDEINSLLSESVNNYIQQNEIEILGQPLPKEDDTSFNWDFNDEFVFNYELGLAPQVDVEFTSKDKLTHYNIKVDDETLASRMKNIRRSYGKMTNPDVVADGDVIFGEFVQLNTDGSVFEGGINVTSSLRLEIVKDEKIKKSLIGLKKEAIVSPFDLVKAIDNETQLIKILKLDEEHPIVPTSKFQLTVKNINRLEESDLNQEFFDKLFGADVVKSEEEFKAKITEELEGMMSQDSDRKLANDLYKYGSEKAKMDLPDEFLKRWLKVANKEVTDEELEKGYDDFAKNLRWTLVENKIVKDQKLEIKYEEVFEAAKAKLDAQFRMYSPQPLTEEQLGQYTAQFLQDKENANRTFDEVKSHKVFEYLKTVITLDQKDITYTKFQELEK
ncbi:MAG: trigger factor [Bacteroidetes bacterium]|nr:trigger factor [Bacteroidota bacterium]MBU1486394.1 trigger factor [Bacteroidota bacterium]MBU2268692.1 trigger factor [Bacteroidota bacterium]MBU2375388.1 trigger factor [Bacteroidota bacterium]